MYTYTNTNKSPDTYSHRNTQRSRFTNKSKIFLTNIYTYTDTNTRIQKTYIDRKHLHTKIHTYIHRLTHNDTDTHIETHTYIDTHTHRYTNLNKVIQRLIEGDDLHISCHILHRRNHKSM